MLFSLQDNLSLVLGVLLFAVKAFALVDCVGRDQAQFGTYHDTLPKNTWLVILVLAVLGHIIDNFSPLGLLSLLGTVAALVYLAQLRGSN